MFSVLRLACFFGRATSVPWRVCLSERRGGNAEGADSRTAPLYPPWGENGVDLGEMRGTMIVVKATVDIRDEPWSRRDWFSACVRQHRGAGP